MKIIRLLTGALAVLLLAAACSAAPAVCRGGLRPVNAVTAGTSVGAGTSVQDRSAP